MAYTLSGTAIKAPNTMRETNSTLFAQQRVLSGSIARDYIGSNKRVWELRYTNLSKTNYDTINTIYQAYLSSGSAVTWAISETNYTVSSTNVHVDLQQREFSVGGSDYISDCTLTLTEA